MKKFLSFVVFLFLLSDFSGFAQNLKDSMDGEVEEIVCFADTLQEYKTLKYRGFEFQVPQNCEAFGQVPYIVKSEDGNFGISLEVGDSRGSDQKRCVAFCKDLSRTLKIEKAKISKVNINGLKGAVVTGEVENQMVTACLLVKGDKELRCIIMNSAQHVPWAEHTIKSFEKI